MLYASGVHEDTMVVPAIDRGFLIDGVDLNASLGRALLEVFNLRKRPPRSCGDR